ncbi:hypothetical protein E2C01_081619 [Portunus trituberculatus]|uniref:Uncharacterized protein n=1 Tax=Portunus trituberculatus TaxID=210409 RepID=A0A5B7IX01_PORTR|nr:hypothetical protein [Portunus trituberculatus]
MITKGTVRNNNTKDNTHAGPAHPPCPAAHHIIPATQTQLLPCDSQRTLVTARVVKEYVCTCGFIYCCSLRLLSLQMSIMTRALHASASPWVTSVRSAVTKLHSVPSLVL